MSTNLEQRSHDLQARLDAIEQELAEIDTSMTAAAAQFSGVDGQQIMREVSQLDARQSALKREKFVALNAQAIVNKQILDEKEAQAAADRRALQVKAKQLADEICSSNSAIDQILKQLVEAFERRASLFHDLGNTGLIDSAVINKLAGKGAATRAACAAHLHVHVSLEKVAQGSFNTLVSTNPILLGIGRDLPQTNGDGRDSLPRHHRRSEVVS
jgi:hypothetical protein